MSTTNKRRAFSLEFKKEVIDAAEKNGNQSALARQFKIPESSVPNILKGKESILKAVADGKESKRARLTPGKNEELEEALIIWFKQVKSENVPVSGDLFKEKALEIASKLGIEEFTASNGCMENGLETLDIVRLPL